MKPTLIISLILAVATSLWAWVPWHRAGSADSGPTSTLLTASGKPVAPESVADLRVATFDTAEKAPKVFQVARKQKKWVIPSHFDYPADAGSKVGDTAGAVLNLKRGPIVSTRKEDQADLGVLDPLAEDVTSALPDARGRRITLKDEGGGTLIDLIVGKSPAGQSDLRYVRMAGSDEVVTAKVDLSSVSTTFRDWVEADPIKISRSEIKRLSVRDYSVNERAGTIADRNTTVLEDQKTAWSSEQTPAGKQVKQEAVNALLGELTALRLVGVRPFDPRWLSRRGFYVGQKPDGGMEIFGNDGELDIETEQGLRYRLFFGEIAVGDEQDTVAAPTSRPATKPTGNNRYMAAFVSYDPKLDTTRPPATQPAGTQPSTQPTGPTPQQIEAGENLAKEKMARFTQFFYVIGNDTFEKLRPPADTLFEPKPAPATAPTTAPATAPATPPTTAPAMLPPEPPAVPSVPSTVPTTAPTTGPAMAPTTAPALPATTVPSVSPTTNPTTAPATQTSQTP